MSIESTRQVAEIGTVGTESIGAAHFSAPSAAADRAWGNSGGSQQVALLQPGDGFQANAANHSYGNESSDFANNFAANFFGPEPATTGAADRPATQTGDGPTGPKLTPGAPNDEAPGAGSAPGAGRRRRSGRSRRSGGSTRARSGRHSRSGRARNARSSSRTGRGRRTGRSQRTGRTQGTGRTRGSSATPPLTGNATADAAINMNNKNFKAGQTKRCADFVSTMLERSGTAPRGFQHQNTVAGLANYGRSVNRQDLKPGDVVMFGNTYKKGKYTHTGIYVGNGKFVHRPTANAPVRTDDLNSRYYSGHYTGARRMQD